MADLRLTDVLVAADWQRLLATLNESLKLNSFALDVDGTFLFPPQAGANKVCHPILGHAIGSARCAESMKRASGTAQMQRGPAITRCHLGLAMICTPVAGEGDTHAGCIGGCGCLDETHPILQADVEALAGQVGVSGETLWEGIRQHVERAEEFQLQWQAQMLGDEIARVERAHVRRSTATLRRDALGLPPAGSKPSTPSPPHARPKSSDDLTLPGWNSR